jgi:hypothetical protein
MTIQYPTWKVRGYPTPNEKLIICPTCGYANWVAHRGGILYCYDHSRKRVRMREATLDEYELGKAAITQVI